MLKSAVRRSNVNVPGHTVTQHHSTHTFIHLSQCDRCLFLPLQLRLAAEQAMMMHHICDTDCAAVHGQVLQLQVQGG